MRKRFLHTEQTCHIPLHEHLHPPLKSPTANALYTVAGRLKYTNFIDHDKLPNHVTMRGCVNQLHAAHAPGLGNNIATP
jgi:hypothetical protein